MNARSSAFAAPLPTAPSPRRARTAAAGLAVLSIAFGADSARAQSIDLDAPTALAPYPGNGNDNFCSGRGVVFTALADLELHGVGYWTDLIDDQSPMHTLWRMWEVVDYPGYANDVPLATATADWTSDLGQTFYDASFAAPIALQAGHRYHIELLFPDFAAGTWFYGYDQGSHPLGWVTLEDGTMRGYTNNPWMPRFRLIVQPQIETYCAPKLNSLGCWPSISASGEPSASQSSGFVVRADALRNRKVGLMFYSDGGRAALPFAGGTLCLSGPLRRVQGLDSSGTPPPVNDCSGSFAIDVNAFRAGALGGNPAPFLSQPGARVQCQFWARDPGYPAPDNAQLTDALEYAVLP